MTRFTGGTVVSSTGTEQRDIYVENGKIAAPGAADKTVDVSGCLLFPGFIDSHTHMQMPSAGTETADTFATGTAAGIAGGTTVILDFATQDRGHTLSEALDVWNSRADGTCYSDYGFHMAVTDWNDATRRELSSMESMGVTSYKAYMAYDGLRLCDDDLRALLAAAGELGAWVGCHCELGDEVNRRIKELLDGGFTGPEYHPKSRPNSVEADAVERFLRLAAEVNGLPWVVHLSTREGLARIEDARANGQRVLTETCPQYLTLTDEMYVPDSFEGAKYVCSPPLRSQADAETLWRAMFSRSIDIVSTDHCSFNFRGQKTMGRGNFSKIPNGLPGIEHRPALMWSCGVCQGVITPEDMCRMLSENPAKAFGLWGRKGALNEGFDADIVVWDPSFSGEIHAADQLMNCDYTPWEGFPLTGRAKAVYLRGTLAAENGQITGTPRGEYLMRGRCV